MDELRNTVLESRAIINYLLLKNNIDDQQFLGMCYFNV